MKQKKYTISQKISFLNKAIFDSMTEMDRTAIVKNFTETGIRILGANFGFAWWKFDDTNEFRLAYKSSNIPYEPRLPRAKAGNVIALKTKKPFFKNVKKENYKFEMDYYHNLIRHLKTYIIIPICHDNQIYGNIVLCYKKRHKFSEEELTLSQAIGNTTAQAIAIHKLLRADVLLREERLKTEFIANATHELRTPLAIMKGAVDLALMKKENSVRNTLKEVNAEINILSDILKDLSLLTSSPFEQNSEHIFSSVPVNMAKLMDDLVKRMKKVASEKNIKISYEKKIPDLFIAGDKKYLERLFINLIRNAITYGKNDGKIIIGSSADKNFLKIKITDDGIGISKEELPKIFDRFYRSEKAHTHSSGNHSGLGLPIAKWVADIHGGRIEVESTEGKGSTFTVILPKLTNS